MEELEYVYIVFEQTYDDSSQRWLEPVALYVRSDEDQVQVDIERETQEAEHLTFLARYYYETVPYLD